jgi:hypothetical protein
MQLTADNGDTSDSRSSGTSSWNADRRARRQLATNQMRGRLRARQMDFVDPSLLTGEVAEWPPAEIVAAGQNREEKRGS